MQKVFPIGPCCRRQQKVRRLLQNKTLSQQNATQLGCVFKFIRKFYIKSAFVNIT